MSQLQSRSSSADRTGFEKEFASAQRAVRKEPFLSFSPPSELWLKFLNAPVQAEYFLLKDGNKILGRAGASISPTRPGIGYLGFFEIDLSSPQAFQNAEALVQGACAWLGSKGAKEVFGPIDLNTWYSYRFSISLEGGRPFSWEPVTPPEYAEYFRQMGFETAEIFHTQGYENPSDAEISQAIAMTQPAVDFARSKGFDFRPIVVADLMSKELPMIYEISMEGFKDNFLFEPLPFEPFRELYAAVSSRVDMSPSWYVIDPKGKISGFVFSFFDGDYVVIKSVAIVPEYRKLHLSTALLHLAFKTAKEKGKVKAISALVKSGSKSEFHENRHLNAGATGWRHEYALFRKALGS